MAARVNLEAALAWLRCPGRTTREASLLVREMQTLERDHGAAVFSERVLDAWNAISRAGYCDRTVEQILASGSSITAADLTAWLDCPGRTARDVGTLTAALQRRGGADAVTAETLLDHWSSISDHTLPASVAGYGRDRTRARGRAPLPSPNGPSSLNRFVSEAGPAIPADLCSRAESSISITEHDRPIADAWIRCAGRTPMEIQAFADRLAADRQGGRAREAIAAYESAQRAHGA